MDKKLSKIIGLKKSEFDQIVNSRELKLREARLIPILKPGDEMALTSVILSSIRLVKEFGRKILSLMNISTSGKIFVYTEIEFPDTDNFRPDGLLIVVRGGVIKDGALFEMKNGADELKKEQIEKYICIAHTFGIPNLITVSNQFVSEPTQFPLYIKSPKNVSLYHFSWSYLLTLAHILLFDNETNIEDEDQVEIMKEVVHYLENKNSGVVGFNLMKQGWKDVVEKRIKGKNLRLTDSDVEDTVSSWKQEEKDLALILSRKLGVFVKSGLSKFKGDLKSRLEEDKKKLVKEKILSSSLNVKGAVSVINIFALFEKLNVEMSVVINAPGDKKLKGQLHWINKQLEICKRKNESVYEKICDEILVEVILRRTNKTYRVDINSLSAFWEKIKLYEIKEFKVIHIKHFGKSFASRKKFVKTIEEMLIDFYSGIIQYLSNWKQPAPKIQETKDPAQKKTDVKLETNSDET